MSLFRASTRNSLLQVRSQFRNLRQKIPPCNPPIFRSLRENHQLRNILKIERHEINAGARPDPACETWPWSNMGFRRIKFEPIGYEGSYVFVEFESKNGRCFNVKFQSVVRDCFHLSEGRGIVDPWTAIFIIPFVSYYRHWMLSPTRSPSNLPVSSSSRLPLECELLKMIPKSVRLHTIAE